MIPNEITKLFTSMEVFVRSNFEWTFQKSIREEEDKQCHFRSCRLCVHVCVLPFACGAGLIEDSI